MANPMPTSAAKSLCDVFYLALVIWREARGASSDAQTAVGWSVMNRVQRPGWWGKTLDEVVTKKWQYSSIAAPGDPQLILWPKLADPSWLAVLGIAHEILYGDSANNVFPGADSYYDSSIAAPKWATPETFCGSVTSPHGNTLRFHDVDQDYEAPTTGHA